MLERLAATRLSVVLSGETGTGKELAARALHAASECKGGPFVVVDCGALPESLAESELFGHEKGAFTGADRARAGAFELASSGTIFLDEIGELSLDLQPKLLRAIERREVKRLGAGQPIDVDVRVVCATHRSLTEMMAAGRFRQDLYYRIAEVILELPPLRERTDDVVLIAERMLADEGRQLGRKLVWRPDALTALAAHSFPGNVRELRNVVRRAAALAEGSEVGLQELALAPAAVGASPSVGAELVDPSLTLKVARERWSATLERDYLTRLLAGVGGDLERAAQIAEIHPKSLQRLLRQHGIGERRKR
jgi:transcriptional regulator with GAF, ATPase, and Fis domain